MTPQLLLFLWRERWDKPQSEQFALPYAQGKLTRWGKRITEAAIWDVPAAPFCIWLGCCLSFALLISAELSLNSQIVFATVVLAGAFYVRRYDGSLVSNVLLFLAAAMSLRYFGWRIGSTLDPDFNVHFVAGLLLCLAEFLVWLPIALHATKAALPIRIASVSLPTKPADWPAVDTLILLGQDSIADITHCAAQVNQLNWPRTTLHFVDTVHRDEVQAVAQAHKAHYFVLPDGASAHNEQINIALHANLSGNSAGSLIAAFEARHCPTPTQWNNAIAWFASNSSLGLLMSPENCLGITPLPQAQAQLIDSAGTSFVMLRRETWAACAKPGTGQSDPQKPWWQLFDATGYTSAHIATPLLEKLPGASSDGASTDLAAQSFYVSHTGSSVNYKVHAYADDLLDMLGFYRPLTKLIFFLMPLAYAYLGIQSVQVSAEFFAAFLIPHWLLSYAVHARHTFSKRLPLALEMRELALSAYILIRTVGLTCFTALRRGSRRLFGYVGSPAPYSEAYPMQLGKQWLLLSVYGGALFFMAKELSFTGFDIQPAAPIFFTWISYHFLLCIGAIAIENEAEQIQVHARSLARQEGMLRLPTGRSVTCTTENFPDTQLRVKLASENKLESATAVSVSVFKGYEEVSFQAYVLESDACLVTLEIDAHAMADYLDFAQTLRARGPNWTRWLPGRHADQLLPAWLSKLRSKFTDLIWHSGSRIGNFFTNLRKGK